MRRGLGTLSCALALLALPLCASAGAERSDSAGERADASGFAVIAQTVLTAIGTTSAGDAVDALRDSLALLGARYRIESRVANEATASALPPEPAIEDEAVSDPSTLPPASAGSNGSHVPHTSSMDREEIFAHSRASAPGESTAILLTGVALAPPDAPEAVKGAINAANTIVGRPYIWGGGHGSWYSHGYDCSGAVSFALFGGGLIPRPLTSSDLMRWGAPGPGRWITVYANPGHTFAEIAGLRWDTVGDEQGTGPRWHLAPTSSNGFVVRHPPGL